MIRCRFLLSLLLVPLAFPVLAAGEGAYTSLFNGSDLTGWRYGKEVLHRLTEPSEKSFSVSGGVINLAAKDKDGKKPQMELISVREFSKDFVIALEFKAAQEATSSFVIRNHPFPVADYIRRGEQTHLKNFKKDDWNEMEITVKIAAYAENRRLNDSDNLEAGFLNGKAWAKLNGRSIDPNRTAIQTEAAGKINGEPLNYLGWAVHVVSNGKVGIRTGSGKFQFRNIRFKEL